MNVNNLIDLLQSYEIDLFHHEVLSNEALLNERIHDDFYEIGASGVVYDKATIIRFLHGFTKDRPIELSNFTITEMTPDLVLAHFVTKDLSTNQLARRSSLWKKADYWQLLFHQGTPAKE